MAFWEVHPRWAKLYVLLVGVPAWVFMFYQTMIVGTFESTALDVAFGAFMSAALLQIAVFFWATSRYDL